MIREKDRDPADIGLGLRYQDFFEQVDPLRDSPGGHFQQQQAFLQHLTFDPVLSHLTQIGDQLIDPEGCDHPRVFGYLKLDSSQDWQTCADQIFFLDLYRSYADQTGQVPRAYGRAAQQWEDLGDLFLQLLSGFLGRCPLGSGHLDGRQELLALEIQRGQELAVGF